MLLLLFHASYCKSPLALILRVVVSFVNSKTTHKLLSKRHEPSYLLDGTSKDRDLSWTYLLNDQSDMGYPTAKRFHLSMRLFALHYSPLTVDATRHMDQPLKSQGTCDERHCYHFKKKSKCTCILNF